jgi:NAD-dependent SIR2 family protein deacetylase
VAKSEVAQRAQRLREQQGFDEAHVHGDYVKVQCSQCQASVINGVACHERGCPNEKRN